MSDTYHAKCDDLTFSNTGLSVSLHRLVRRDAIEIIVRRSKMGDWFLLYLLGENIDTVIFRDVVQDLANRLGHNQHHRVPGLKGEIQDA